MSDQDQDAIDALLADNSESEGSPAPEEAHDETIAETSVNQEEQSAADDTEKTESAVESPGEAVPKGIPWVDFIPKDLRPKAETVEAALEKRQEDLEAELVENEKHVLDFVWTGAIDIAYYNFWIEHYNCNFRAAVRLKNRRLQILAKKAASSGGGAQGDVENLNNEGSAETSETQPDANQDLADSLLSGIEVDTAGATADVTAAAATDASGIAGEPTASSDLTDAAGSTPADNSGPSPENALDSASESEAVNQENSGASDQTEDENGAENVTTPAEAS